VRCNPCASCSIADEVTLCRLKPMIAACDCSHIEIDPCSQPDSCACQCSKYQAALAACPP
jgi:hypothetical protein